MRLIDIILPSEEDLTNEEREIFEAVEKLSNPGMLCDREEYNKSIGIAFGEKTVQYFDKQDISHMMQAVNQIIPDELFDTISAEALEISNELELFSKAEALLMVLENYLGQTGLTVEDLLVDFPLSEIQTEKLYSYPDESEDSENEDDEEYEDDEYGFDEDDEEYE